MPADLPDAQTRWRCGHCGNLTRFDVTRTTKVKEYWHLDLAGESHVEESETLGSRIELVACRWCGADDAVELVPRAASTAVSGGATGGDSGEGSRPAG